MLYLKDPNVRDFQAALNSSTALVGVQCYTLGGQHTNEACRKILLDHGFTPDFRGEFKKSDGSQATCKEDLIPFQCRLGLVLLSPFTYATCAESFPHILNGLQLLGRKLNHYAALVKPTTTTDILKKVRTALKRDITNNFYALNKRHPDKTEIWPNNELERRNPIYAKTSPLASFVPEKAKGMTSTLKELCICPPKVCFILALSNFYS
jgi:hypothetical protein